MAKRDLGGFFLVDSTTYKEVKYSEDRDEILAAQYEAEQNGKYQFIVQERIPPCTYKTPLFTWRLHCFPFTLHTSMADAVEAAKKVLEAGNETL